MTKADFKKFVDAIETARNNLAAGKISSDDAIDTVLVFARALCVDIKQELTSDDDPKTGAVRKKAQECIDVLDEHFRKN